MAYIVGVSSGLVGAAAAEDRAQILGIPKKVFYSITQGVNFTQVDLESITEFKDPEISTDKSREEWKEKIKRMGISFGFHGESYAMSGREIPVHLDSAIEDDYIRSHERLILSLEESGKLGAKYFLLHSTESTPFILLGKELQPTKLVDIYGRPLTEFLEKEENLVDWAIVQPFITEVFMHGHLHVTFEDNKNATRDQLIEAQKGRRREEFYNRNSRYPTEEEIALSEEENKELEKRAEEITKRSLKEALFNFIATRGLSYGAEKIAYYVTAKWMEDNKDEMWTNIINSSIQYYAAEEGKDVEKWKAERKISKLSMDDPELLGDFRLWVPSVAAKYIFGHLNPIDSRFKDPKKILDENKLYFVLETPTGYTGGENLGRFVRPTDFYYLIQAIDSDYIRIAVDFEHMLGNNINPEIDIKLLPDGGGAKVLVVHTNYPTPIHVAHIPIAIGSEQQMYIYKRLLELRKKGFTCEKEDSYIIYERGGAPIQQSILSLKLIVQFLKDEVPPEKLPLEFFGMDTGQIASEERQLATIREHAFDPLKGMITVPEEEHGLLGRAAADRYKQEEWRKEKYR